MRSVSKKLWLAILLVALSLGWVLSLRWPSGPSFSPAPSAQSPALSSPEPAVRLNWLEAHERKIDATAWAEEMLAQQCGLTLENLWDAVNAATNKLRVLATFPLGEITLGQWDTPQSLPHDIRLYPSSVRGLTLSAAQWRERIEQYEREGWQLETLEFRQNRFDTDDAGQPKQSVFFFSAHMTHAAHRERVIAVGDLVVDWGKITANADPVPVQRIDASRLTIKTRRGEPALQLLQVERVTPQDKSTYIDPLILYDLDGDGLSEIILAAKNLLYRRNRQGQYGAEPLCQHPPDAITTAIIADFDGNGTADFLCAKAEGLLFYPGSARGTFEEPGRLVWPATFRLFNAMALTAGDIDHDGDLDLFLGQYRVPLLGQVLRPHYYDANDGHASYLLLNDGSGHFKDATEAAGLSAKRWRRCFSSSFVDLDDDSHLDLVVVSDFAGLDLYRNDGQGHFTDVTHSWVADSRAFGMAHALADFNVDGRLDLLMIGMPSPTVNRLEHLRLWRPEATEDRSMRARMAFGNRLYLAQPETNGFKQTALNDSIQHSGWSWGGSVFDFDNDRFPDVYITNGLQTKESVRDYEPEFWLHDIYVNETADDLVFSAYFMNKFGRTRGQGWSYGGYEKNRLYLNQRGASFLEIGHLMGVALEQDCRVVVTDDLNGDGRLDLLVTTLEVWPEPKETLRIYQNVLPHTGHWIGFRFRETGGGNSPIGARVTLHSQGHRAVRHIVTGDSHRSQHAPVIHFGLGPVDQVDRVEIRWPNGQTTVLSQPAVDRYHDLNAQGQSR